METTEVRRSRPGARAAAALFLAIAGLTAGCGGANPAAENPAKDQRTAEQNLTSACLIRPTPLPAPSPGAEDCETAVRRLNGVLSGALSGPLPKSAVLTNNLISDRGGYVGGEGMTFIGRHGETGGIVYEASVRIRNADRAANLRVEVTSYDTAPAKANCPDKERAADMKRKGMVMHRCDRKVDAEGNIILVADNSAPYGEAEWAKILLRSYYVAVYRKDGIVVHADLEPVVERAPDLSTTAAGEQPTMLTLEQVRAVAFNRGFALTR